MERALVVVEPTDTAKELAYEAGTIAEGVGADLVLTHITTEQEYSARRGAMESLMSSSASYTVGEAEEGATQFASDIGDEVLSDLDVEYEVEGFLGNKAEKILDAADEYDCDHVFLTGRQRSPTGKALFGDATQGVILDFEGPVTVLTG
ncbi:universal stress protein UspA [Haladaptatus sp. R4]|uniref:universal stress protein n=1 Tax=Haladaptatus sp. R4 TaxID=1679489 RepID=UPI0007B4C5F2|nr:universal stress protein [Haladaptatus sp. R4]KZN26326.1 universal stress protein UspA [Haladaptatus sp. R4]